MAVVRIICLLFPFIGLIIAIKLWLFKQDNRADEALFFSFLGIFVNVFLLLPVFLVVRAFF